MTPPPVDFRDAALTAAEVRSALDLKPHPEGGHYRELWRDAPADGGRGAATSIYFLLAAGERSHWHRVDAVEIWVWLAGAPLLLELNEGSNRACLRLGPDGGAGETFQGIVPPYAWQAASSLGAWTLVSCIVAPRIPVRWLRTSAARLVARAALIPFADLSRSAPSRWR